MTSRLFSVGVAGPRLSGAEREILRRDPPYGAILFARNLETAAQVSELAGELRGLGVRLSFLDQEGGRVDRLKGILGPAPSLHRASLAGAAFRSGELAGRALRALGLDVDLAPVVDRGLEGAGGEVLGERAASADPAEVVRAAGDFLDGLHAAGAGGCLKHFPGLGRARLDTHVALPVLADDPREQALDLAPFEALMRRAGAVMISHAAHAAGLPASLDPSWATGKLRDEMGFDGAAFSDDLEMGALDAFGDLAERSVRAAQAGCDLLFVCSRIQEYPGCVDAVRRRVDPARRAAAEARLEVYAAHVDQLRASAGGAGAEAPEAVAADLLAFRESLG